MAISRLIFDSEAGTGPYDLDGHLTQWVEVVAGDGVPATVSQSPIGWARYFAGSLFQARDDENLYMGLDALTVRLLWRPDPVNPGINIFMGRGSGGPTAANYHSFVISYLISGGDLILSVQWQRPAGTYTSHTFTPSPAIPFVLDQWYWVSIARERLSTGSSELRLSVNGVTSSTVISSDDISATPFEYVGVGSRPGGVPSAGTMLRGDIAYMEIADTAETPLQARHRYYELMESCGDALAIVDTEWFPRNGLLGPEYTAYKLQPWACVTGGFRTEALRRDEAMVPPAAYGNQLERFERAINRTPRPSETVAQRQAAVAAHFAETSGFRVPELLPFLSGVYDLPEADITIQELSTDYYPVVTASPTEPLDQPWLIDISGGATAERTATGLRLFATSAVRTYNPSRTGGASLVELPAGGDSIGFACRLVSTTSGDYLGGLGPFIRSGAEILQVFVRYLAPDYRIRYVYYDIETGTLSAEQFITNVVTADAPPVDLAMYQRDDSVWVLRWKTVSSDWTEFEFPGSVIPNGPIGWVGLGQYMLAAAGDKEATFDSIRVLTPDISPAHWTAWAEVSPPNPDPYREAALIDTRNRAAATAGPSYDPYFKASSTGSFASWTSTIK